MKKYARRHTPALVLFGIMCGAVLSSLHAQEAVRTRPAFTISASDRLGSHGAGVDSRPGGGPGLIDEKAAERSAATRRKLLNTCVILIIGYLSIVVLVSIINRRVKDLKIRHEARKHINYFVTVVMIICILFLWAQSITSLTIFLGIAGAGMALALQEVILCIAGWFNIVTRRPFEVGDRIEMAGIKGDVIDIRLLQTALLEIGNWVDNDQSTGRIVNIPNSMIFKRENFNYNKGFEFIWNEIKILVTYESDWKRAEEIMLAHARVQSSGMEEVVKKKIHAMTRRYMIHYDKLSPIVYVSVRESGVELALRYLTEAKLRRTTHDAISRAILDDFSRQGVQLAYHTYRIVK
ncbi:MAG: mechanosensitive ion channel family protein [Candidatus Aureabacteria bacterium]|nr:mechanosensitive ion channel family protein [Candidatus Auribacterota bacterium]